MLKAPVRRRGLALLCAAALGVAAPAFAATAPAAATDASALVEAARDGDAKAVEALLKARAPVNATTPDGATALSWAVANSDADLVARLIAAGADANIGNDYGVTPLIIAVRLANAPIVKALLDAKANPNQGMWTGEAPLMFASRDGLTDIMQQLLAQGAQVDQRETRHGQTALMWAAAAGKTDAVRLLIANKANVALATPVAKVMVLSSGSPTTFDNSEIGEPIPAEKGGLTALMFAAGSEASNSETVAALLDADPAAVNRAAQDGTTPLLFSLYRHIEPLHRYPHDFEIVGDIKIADLLIKRGANPNLGDVHGLTPLGAVVFSSYGTDHSGQVNVGPPLRPHPVEAAEQAKLLLANGADPNIRATFATPAPAGGDLRSLATARYMNVSPFLLAAALNQPQMVDLMMATGRVNISTPRDGGNTPLMDAVQTVSPLAVTALIKAGAAVNAVNSVNGQTALHMAAVGGNGSGPIVEYLVAHGAKYNIKDKAGKTAVDLALLPVPPRVEGNYRAPIAPNTVLVQTRLRTPAPGARGQPAMLTIAGKAPPAPPPQRTAANN